MLSYGNKKLPKGTAIFNIPAQTTCPGASTWCKKNCYAKKAERQYPQVLPFRKRNHYASTKEHFTSTMADLINKKPVKVFRIHESGDFYNQKYLDKWISIAKTFPNTVFYAYTKSDRLDFSQLPGNFKIMISYDPSRMPEKRPEWAIGRFITIETSKDTPKRAFMCPEDCRTCNKCWTKGEDVYNVKH